jgi:diguanylate cyclase (GGDEF)-like protein
VEHVAQPLALAADDDPDIRCLVVRRLELLGYRVLEADDGDTALRMATDEGPEVAVLDIAMGGLDGVEVARRLRAAPGTREMAVILLTARDAEADVERGFDAGADDYIKKPFSARELSESVRRVAADRGLRRREAVARRVAALEAALGRVATAVATEATPRAVFALAAEEAGRLLEADVAAVVRSEPGALTGRVTGVWTRARAAGDLAGAPLAIAPDDAVARAVAAGRPQGGRLPLPDPFRGAAGRAVPVTAAGAPWGALVVAGARAESDARDDDHLARFARLIGLAVANAEARTALVALASTDGLTGLPNQRTFRERLADEVSLARLHGRRLALALFDLDRFKRVNDTHGHEAGDRVLAETARRLAAEARRGELVARAGGEEFAWILPDTGGPGAMAAAERALRAVSGTPFPGVGTLTMSGGVAALDEGADARELFRRADAALYRAKAAGRDTVALHRRGESR